MSETAAVMHSEPQGATPTTSDKRCAYCRTTFKPRRSWGRFCTPECKRDFHALRRAAPLLLEALLIARECIRGRDLEHVWLNAPQEPALTLGAKIDRALAKAKPGAVKG